MAPAGKLVAVALLVILLASCSGSTRHSANPPTPSGTARDRWGITWLCRPGESDNPCLSDLTTTTFDTTGARAINHLRTAVRAPIDCFYVYPTVSGEHRINANLAIDLRLREVAVIQAARFSQVCRIYAPVYRQITLTALEHPNRITLAHALVAYHSVDRAFRTYLAHYNQGRGIVLIGHSQGAAILDRLVSTEIDHNLSLRRRLVSALLLGANVTNHDFVHIRPCRSPQQIGCVVAYSSFTTTPSARSQFGRTTSDAGVALLARRPTRATRVVCVNPAAPGGGTAPLDPAVPSIVLPFLASRTVPVVSTPWVSFPGRYAARCDSSGNASWLQISQISRGPGPALTRLESPAFGLHLLDVNIALDDLVRLVRAQARTYVHR